AARCARRSGHWKSRGSSGSRRTGACSCAGSPSRKPTRSTSCAPFWTSSSDGGSRNRLLLSSWTSSPGASMSWNAPRPRDVETYLAENVAFHDRLVELAGNSKLLGMYRRLVNELHLFRHATLAQGGVLPVSTRE